MRRHHTQCAVLAIGLALALLLAAVPATLAFPADASINAVWSSTDRSVADGGASYSWF